MITLINLGYFLIIYLLMLLTDLINNQKIELIAVISIVIVVYIIYFSLFSKLLTYLEKQRMIKLGINYEPKLKVKQPNKNLKLYAYVAFSSMQIFVTDNKNNLLYKVRMKGNLTQNYKIYDAHHKKVGRIWRVANTYFTKLNKKTAQLFMQKFWRTIRLNYYRLPLQIYYNENNKKIEVRSTIDWSEIYGQMAYHLQSNVVSCNIKLSNDYQEEVLLFYISYIARFYYHGNN